MSPQRIHEESRSVNNKYYKGKFLKYKIFHEESAILDKVTIDIKRLRDQHKFVYDRVPHDRID